MFVGWMAIRESWVTIFANTENIKFTINNSKTRIYQEVIAVITCLKNIEIFRNEVKIQKKMVNNSSSWLISIKLFSTATCANLILIIYHLEYLYSNKI